MNTVITVLFLFFSNLILAQKNYKIDNIFWTYEKPNEYIYKTDNFSEMVKLGDKLLKNIKNVNLNAEEDVLFSIAKEENSNFNIIISSYLSDKNIKTFGIENYVNELVKIFTKQYAKLETPISITKQKIKIDNKTFYLIKNDVSNPKKKYKTYMYIGKIGNKELQISVVTDNEKDESLITKSILKSKFK